MLRFSTIKEIEGFYTNEFDVNSLKKWFNIKPSFFLVCFSNNEKYAKFKDKLNVFKILNPNTDYKALKEKLIYYAPEGVYYDRNLYKDVNKCYKCNGFRKYNCLKCKNWAGQELAFDLDPENIEKIDIYPNFSVKAFNQVVNNAFEFKEELEKLYSDVRLIYSGRGVHAHVFDEEAYKLTSKERVRLTTKFKKYKFDSWVSQGNIRLIRLPFSLHGKVSRIVMPINKKFKGLNDKKIIPRFLKN